MQHDDRRCTRRVLRRAGASAGGDYDVGFTGGDRGRSKSARGGVDVARDRCCEPDRQTRARRFSRTMPPGVRQSERMGAVDRPSARVEQRRAEVRDGWGEIVPRARCTCEGQAAPPGSVSIDCAMPTVPVLPDRHAGQLRARRSGRTNEPRPAPVSITAVHSRVHGRWIVVIANDNTVASGSWWPQTPEKIQRAQEIALRLRLAGRLPRRLLRVSTCRNRPRPFPDATGAGAIFRMNSLLSDARVFRRSPECTVTASPAAATCRSSATSST